MSMLNLFAQTPELGLYFSGGFLLLLVGTWVASLARVMAERE